MRVRILGVGCLLFVALAPGSAHAAIYCVHAAAADCTGEIDKGLNLSSALSDAAASAENDTISIRPGEYTGTSVAPFNYLGDANSGELRVVGSGAGAGGTVLKRDPGNITRTVIMQGPVKKSIEDLAIEVPNGSTGGQNVGLSFLGSGAANTQDHVADGLAITLPASPTPGSGPLVGVQLQDSTFRNGTVTGPVAATPVMQGVLSSGADLIEDATISARTAIALRGGGTARRIDATGATGFEVISNTGTGFFTVEDSLWRPSSGSGRGLDVTCGALSANVTLRNTTFVNPPASGTDTIISCLGGTGRLDIHSSILSGGAQSIQIGSGANVTAGVSYTDFDPAKIVAVDPNDVQQGPGNLNVAPGFLGAGDFRLAADSPLLDKGNPAALVADESTTDLDGLPRVVDAFPLLCSTAPPRRDMGAFEYQPPAPPPGSCGGPVPIDPVPPEPLTCHGLIPTITGTEASETLIGTNGADVIAALGGNDKVKGALGKDVICGGTGKDVLKGGAGTDELYGDQGRDKLSGGGSEGDLCDGGASKDTGNASCEKGPDSQ